MVFRCLPVLTLTDNVEERPRQYFCWFIPALFRRLWASKKGEGEDSPNNMKLKHANLSKRRRSFFFLCSCRGCTTQHLGSSLEWIQQARVGVGTGHPTRSLHLTLLFYFILFGFSFGSMWVQVDWSNPNPNEQGNFFSLLTWAIVPILCPTHFISILFLFYFGIACGFLNLICVLFIVFYSFVIC